MKCRNIAMAKALEEENKRLQEGNDQLRHILYHRKFITNPTIPNERED